uniref:Uncharacterized protein n=1 Tax=Lepeophtheirus salmonis TaxID=72036 RepID=A0A0K2VHK2_LEPSM
MFSVIIIVINPIEFCRDTFTAHLQTGCAGR